MTFTDRWVHHVRDHYVGLFEDPSGDKGTHYDASPFIESRLHTNQQENVQDIFKIQTGVGDGEIWEPWSQPKEWSPEETHTVRIEWRPIDPTRGQAWLYLDGQEAGLNYPAYYNNPNIGWRYLFIGTTNYKNLDWGMIHVTYKNLCVVADE